MALNVAAEQLYYMYKDSKGRTHIEDSISDKHAKYGYRIVNSQGLTIKVVPGTREKKRKEARLRKQNEKAQKKQNAREADEFLLKTFVSEEDIRQTGNKKIMAIQSQIETTNKHIEAFEKNLAQLEEQVHRADLDGREVTDKQVNDIKRIKDSIVQNKQFVVRKIEQQETIRDQYVEYIRRYKALTARK